ncbi:MAG: IS21-like element helper ATPase IstB [Sphaerochaeta sp.]|jgi:DNA replication protein DnaC
MSKTVKHTKHDNVMLELDMLMRKFYFSRDTIAEARETGTPGQVKFFAKLLGNEVERRSVARVSRMIKGAGFPTIKSIDDYDFSNVSFPQLMGEKDIRSLSFIDKKRTLVFYGICGSGKTMLATCLGLKACNEGYKVKFMTITHMVARLTKAREEGYLEKFLLELGALDLLILDEWGYCQISRDASQLLFQVIAESYEKKSLIVTTNLPFSEWGKLMTDEQIATAIIDRLVHYGHLINTGSKDWRLEHSLMKDQIVTTVKMGKGGNP